MNWQQACQHKNLQNLPFKIELDEKGRILMSPVKVYHSAYQGKIAAILDRLIKGNVLTECAVKTCKGTKVADVAWMSADRFRRVVNEAECSIAPEICVEVLSSSNTQDEIKSKKELYFEKGCKEVWVCSKKGNMTFYISKGKVNKSFLVPDFPEKIDLYT